MEELLSLSIHEATTSCADAIEPVHLFLALCAQGAPEVVEVLHRAGLDPELLRRRIKPLVQYESQRAPKIPRGVSRRVTEIFALARQQAVLADRAVDHVAVLLSMLELPDMTLLKVIKEEQLPVDSLVASLRQILMPSVDTNQLTPSLDSSFVTSPSDGVRSMSYGGEAPGTDPSVPPVGVPAEHRPTPTLDRCGRDLTALARQGKLGPIIGREVEIRQAVRVLLRKQKSNPVLIGEPGVGKTSVVEGLAITAGAPNAPKEIRDLRIVEVMMSSLLAETTYRGELEEKLEKILKESEDDPFLVIFFDEFHTLVGAGTTKESPLDVANMLKPALGRGRLRCVGATTIVEYRRYIEKDAALERRFQPVLVKEPTPEEARAVLEGLRPSYEDFHRVTITDEALDAAVAMSIRYLPDRRLPDKARDLVDQAAVNVRVFNLAPGSSTPSRTEVTEEDVVQVAAEWSGVPLERMSVDERERLLHMEEALARRVVGQDAAIAAVSQVIRTALAGLSHPRRPHGVFLFMGRTGVGKTELAKALAEFLFHDEKALIRFDMSEFMEDLSVSKLIGAPPGYIGHDDGGQLTDAVRTTPYSVVLFDEIEKAHPEVIGIFLQVFDEGRLTDSKGRQVDFSNTVIIMTSNLGSELSAHGRHPIGFESGDGPVGNEPSPERDREALLSFFRPELINRINCVVRFRPLGEAEVRTIIDKLIAQVGTRLRDKEVTIRLAPSAYEVLMNLGYSEDAGAREMERAVERHIVAPLAEGLISGQFLPGATVEVKPKDGLLVLEDTRVHCE